MSNLIDSFASTNTFLSYLCICPFKFNSVTKRLECHRYHIIYHILSLILYEIILLISAYNKFMHGMLVQTNLSQGSVLITWVMLARSFTIGVILSLANHTNQIELFNKLCRFDRNLMVTLHRQMTYTKSIRHLAKLSTMVVIYNYAIYIILAIYYNDNLCTIIFYACCTHADVYFSIYLLYISFWGKLYTYRFSTINDALRRLFEQPRIFHKTMENILQLYNEISEIREAIEQTFGSIIFYTIFYHSLTIAVAIYAIINSCIIHVDNLYEDLVVGLTWLIPLGLRGWYLVCVFDTFGEQVANACCDGEVFFYKFCF